MDYDARGAWIERRLSNPSRYETGVEFELPRFIRFALESETLPRMLAVLDANSERLEAYELKRLEMVWPETSRQVLREGGRSPIPLLEDIVQWESETIAGRLVDEDEQVASLNRYLQPSWRRHGSGTDEENAQ